MTAEESTYSKNIGNFQSNEIIEYYIHVSDKAGNTRVSATYSFIINISNGETSNVNFGGFYAFLTVALCVAVIKMSKRK